MVTDLRCSGSFGYRSNAVLAKGGHSLHLFPEQTASASQPGDFLGGWATAATAIPPESVWVRQTSVAK